MAAGVVAGYEADEEFFQILLGVLHAMRQSLLTEDAEKAFDEVHPGSVRGSVMELDPWISPEPATKGFILVDV